jgi:phosphatidylinositol alpha-mannosyltransferase
VRIGLVSPYSWTVPGGVNHHVEHLAAELEERGHEPWILAPVGAPVLSRRSVGSRRHPSAERFVPLGGALPLPANGSRAYMALFPQAMARVDRAIRFGRFDLLHVHEPFTPLVAAAAVLFATSPVVGTFHAARDPETSFEGLEWVIREIARRVDVRIAVSEAAQVWSATRYGGEYRIIPNGVSVERLLPARDAEKVDGRILFIGRADPRKGLQVLLPAFAQVRQHLPRASLVIAGATERQVHETVRGLSRDPLDLGGVEALGWVDHDEKVAQLGRAQLVCAPSLDGESFGIVLAEAMAAGVPVVASDLPGYRAVLKSGGCGRLVPPGDVAALGESLAELLGDPDERRRLTAAGTAAAEDLSWRRVTDSILAAYDDALATPARRGHHGLPGRPWLGRALVEYWGWLAFRASEDDKARLRTERATARRP